MFSQYDFSLVFLPSPGFETSFLQTGAVNMKRHFENISRKRQALVSTVKSYERPSPSIWVVGRSILMDGIAASLEARQFNCIVRLSEIDQCVDQEIHTGTPDLIIFEISPQISPVLIEILGKNARLHLLGLDRESNLMIVLDSFQFTTRSMDDFFNIVHEIIGETRRIPTGGNPAK